MCDARSVMLDLDFDRGGDTMPAKCINVGACHQVGKNARIKEDYRDTISAAVVWWMKQLVLHLP